MTVETTRKVIMKYFDTRHTDLSIMADDVVFTLMATGDEHKTPAGVQGMLQYLYDVAFDATTETTNLVIADNQAVWEGYFIGKHVGEFNGIPATGKDVRVPICVSYDIENDQIKRARIYFELPVMLQQLGIQ